MRNLNFSGEFLNSDAKVDVNVGVFQFKEDGAIIVYSPAFDLSGYGKSDVEAKESFEEALDEFFRYTINRKTLIPELKRLGWDVVTLKQKRLKSPLLADLITKNDYLSEILNDKEFTKFDHTVSVPC